MGLGLNIEEEMLGPSQGPARALAQGPGPHFLLNIQSQAHHILQLPASQLLEAAPVDDNK